MLIIRYRRCRALIEGKRRFPSEESFWFSWKWIIWPPSVFWADPRFCFLFLQSFVDRLSSEWWNIRSDRSQKRRTGRVGSGRVKVKTTCSDPELPGPLYDSSLLYVYNDWPGLLYSVPGFDRSFLLSAVIRGIWTIVCRRPFSLLNTCSGLIFMIEVDFSV